MLNVTFTRYKDNVKTEYEHFRKHLMSDDLHNLITAFKFGKYHQHF